MSFTSTLFLHKFLPMLLLTYYFISYCLKNKTRVARNQVLNVILLIFSILFYISTDTTIYNFINKISFTTLIQLSEIQQLKIPNILFYILLSIIICYLCGLLIHTHKFNNKTILIIGIVLELGILFYFKYFNFFLKTFSQPLFNIILPIGISFYIFQAISYLWDCYHNPKLVQKNFFFLFLYIILFFQLIAGPIVKYHDIESQFFNRNHNIVIFFKGVKRFLLGVCKKIYIADSIGIIVNNIFITMINGNNQIPILDSIPIDNISPIMLWIGSIFYALQIYYDFSAYSDMAIGLASMFGFSLLENFHFPYISKSITEFWKRWHISLTNWFREYIYIPLGGNRKGIVRTCINLLFIFVLSGFWHGANWNFLIWGLIHGLFLILERFGFNKNFPIFLSYLYTMIVIVVAWIFFYFTDLSIALAVLRQMFNVSKWLTIPNYAELFFLYNSLTIYMLFIFLIALFFCTPFYSSWKSNLLSRMKSMINISEMSLLLLLFILGINLLSDQSSIQFIYFQF